jgi:hypothetical protein
MQKIVLIGLSLLGFPAAAFAQEMSPLSELIASGSEDSYPLVRCAGLYLSGLEWGGENRLGKDTTLKIKSTVAHIVGLAVDLRTKDLGDGAEASVLRDVRNISDGYLARYEANYASSGQAWGNDGLWQSDTDVCNLLLGGK